MSLDSVIAGSRRGALPGVSLRYRVEPRLLDWELPEGNVPESRVHDLAVKRLVALLDAWAEHRPDVLVARNLAIRWLEEAPKVGIDPDVCLISPVPPASERLDSLRLWVPGHHAPPLCFEIVSKSHPYKDYGDLHERYAALGAPELVVFDPLLAGPKALGGPVPLQLWRRDSLGILERTHFGPGPVYSEVLDAWISVEDQHLSIAGDAAGGDRWLTIEERERSEKERERSEKERERSEKERERSQRLELERRLAELERPR